MATAPVEDWGFGDGDTAAGVAVGDVPDAVAVMPVARLVPAPPVRLAPPVPQETPPSAPQETPPSRRAAWAALAVAAALEVTWVGGVLAMSWRLLAG